MAMSQEALDIILRLQGVPTYTAGMGAASDANDKFTASSKRAAGMSNEAAAASEKQAGAAALVSKAMKATGLLLAAAGVEGVKMAIKFERQMELIHTQAGASQKEVEKLKGAVLGLAGSVPQGPEELAKALYHLESIGLRGAAAMSALKVSAQGAAVGGAELEDTTTALGAAWIVGAKGAGNLHNVMGILNATVGAGNLRMEELVQSLGSGIIPLTKVAHISIQDIGAAMATLSDSGYNASSAMAQLGTSLHFLYDPTAKARKALESIGLTSQQVFKEMSGPNGLPGALKLLKTHLEGAGGSAEQAEKIGEILPGGRGKVLLTLIEELERFENKKKQIIANSGQFDDAVKRTMEQPAVRIANAWSGFRAELIRVGQALEGPATTAMVAFAKVLQGALGIIMALTLHGKLLVPVVLLLAGAFIAYKAAVMGAAVATAAMDLGETIALLAMCLPEVESLTAAWVLLDGVMDANPIGLIAVALVALGALIYAFRSQIMDVVKFIGQHWRTLLYVLIGPIAFFVLLAVDEFGKIKRVISGVADWLSGAWSKVGKVLAWPFERMWEVAKWVFGEIKNLVKHIPGLGLLEKGAGLVGKGISFLEHPHFASGGVMPYSGYATINEGASGETVYLPGGSVVQPSPANSMGEPRAHTPNPGPLNSGTPIIIEAFLMMPPGAGRSLFKLVTKEAAIKSARS